MRKLDYATGVTLEVPSEAPPLGQFPYPGFWAEIVNQIPAVLTQRGRTGGNRYQIAQSITHVANLANGAYKITVEEKLWRIGEIMRLNQFVSAHGDGGSTLGYVGSGPAHGRVQVAAIAFEPMITAVMQKASASAEAQGDLQTATAQYQTKLEQMRGLMEQLASIEAAQVDHGTVRQMQTEYTTTVRTVETLTGQIAQLEERISMAVQARQAISQMSSEIETMTVEHNAILSHISKIQAMLNSAAATNNTGQIRKYEQELTRLNVKNQSLKQRIENLGVRLHRMLGQQTNEENQRAILQDKKAQLRISQTTANQLANQLEQIAQAATQAQAGHEAYTNQVATLTAETNALANQISNAQATVEAAALDNEVELMRVWVSHLSGVYRDTEAYMFENLRRAAAAATSPPGSMGEYAVDAVVIAQMEDFLSAVDAVPGLDRDEKGVLEQIARFGASQSYVPGAARVIALSDMTQAARIRAYRAMVDEIVSQGAENQSLETRKAAFKLGPIRIGTTEPLHEVQELLKHLTDASFERR